MDEYIKKKDLLKAFPKAEADVFENCRNCTCLDSEQIEDIIKSIPAADVIERKHGKWELFNNSGLGFSHSCSLCNFEVRERWIDLYNFCPNCGADMRGEDDV